MNVVETDSEPARSVDDPVGEAFWATDVHVALADVGNEVAKGARVEANPLAASDEHVQLAAPGLHQGRHLVLEYHLFWCRGTQHDHDVNVARKVLEQGAERSDS